MPTPHGAPAPRNRYVSLALACTPACALVGGLPFVNRLEPTVVGLPFLLLWILGWVMLTPAFLFAVYRVQRPRQEDGIAKEPGPGEGSR